MKKFTPATVAMAAVLALLIQFSGIAWAQTTDAAAQYDFFMSLFSATAASWEGVLLGYASTIFWSLAVIELVVVFIPMVFKGADIAEFLAELVRYVLIIGFFWLVLTQGSVWANAIVQSMRQAGAAAGGVGVGLSPSAVIATGFDIGIQVTQNISVFSPGVSIAFVAAWIVLILAFAYIAAMIGVALIESYIIIYGAVIFLGLGASRFTRDYSIIVLRYALAVGAKLFVLTLIVNLLQGAFGAWATYWDETLTAATSLMGLAILAALITKMIPELVTAMITGQTSSSGPVGGMATTFLAAGAAATGLGIGLGAAAAGGAGAAGGAAGGASGAVSGASGLADAMQYGLSARSGLTPGVGGTAGGGAVGGGGGAASGVAKATGAAPAAKAAGAVPGVGQQGGGGFRPSAAGMANAAFRSTGTLSELVVPGMEGASAVGVAPQFGGPNIDLGDTTDSRKGDDPAMVIEAAQGSRTSRNIASGASDDVIEPFDPPPGTQGSGKKQ